MPKESVDIYNSNILSMGCSYFKCVVIKCYLSWLVCFEVYQEQEWLLSCLWLPLACYFDVQLLSQFMDVSPRSMGFLEIADRLVLFADPVNQSISFNEWVKAIFVQGYNWNGFTFIYDFCCLMFRCAG